VFRPNPENRRKEYWAMTFSLGKEIEAENKALVVDILKEIHEKTTGTPFAEAYVPPTQPEEDAIEYPTEDINPDDIPF
jgi:hypothetical protein